LAGLQLRDSQQQARLGLVLHAPLLQPLVQELSGLVVLAVAEVREAHPDVFVTRRRGIGLGSRLAQRLLVRFGSLLSGRQQALVLVLRARIREDILLETL